MPESLGTKLRVAREAKGYTVDQLSLMTKISANFIIALESGRWDLLPGRVYLKPFTKLCAEALGLDVKELYDQIDGGMPDDKKRYEAPPSDPNMPVAPSPKKVDYKLPIVAISVLVIILLISFAVKTKQFGIGVAKRDVIVPARTSFKKEEIKWNRPWERPSSVQYSQSQRLRLEADKADIWACVIADEDTVFKGTIPAQNGKTFFADDGFKVTLSRNEGIAAYLNGVKVKGIGVSPKKITNFPIALPSEEDTTADEAK